MTAFFERRQITFYWVAIFIGLSLAFFFPTVKVGEVVLQAMLIALLFLTFLQVPVRKLSDGLKDKRFIFCLLIGNFILIPVVVAVLIGGWLFIFNIAKLCSVRLDASFPDIHCELGILIPAAIVLCAPCVDYVISFCRAARGNASALTAAIPTLLLLQFFFFLLLIYALTGSNIEQGWSSLFILGKNFILIIVMPMLAAWCLQSLSGRFSAAALMERVLQAWVVPVTALTLLVIIMFAGTTIFQEMKGQYLSVSSDLSSFSGYSLPIYWKILAVLPLYVAFHCLAPFVGWFISRVAQLRPSQAIAVCFSLSTRNSLVILPLVIIIDSMQAVLFALIILTQTCVELVAEVIYIHVIPWLFKNKD